MRETRGLAMPNNDYEGLSGSELDAAVRRRVEGRMKARNGFYIHFIVFLGANLFLWMIGLTTGSLEVPWPLFATIPWAMALAIHGFVVYQESAGAIQRRQERIQREVEMEKMRLGLGEKP